MRKYILAFILLLTATLLGPPKVTAQTDTECTYKSYQQESYKCLGVFDECQDACQMQATGSYLDEITPSDKYSACMEASDCHGKSAACNDQAWADYQACKKAGESEEDSPKDVIKNDVTSAATDKSEQSDFSAIDSYVGLIWQQISRYLGLDKLEGVLGETILHSVGKKSLWEKEAEHMSGESYKALQEAAAQRRLEKPKFFPVTAKEEFIFVTYLDKSAVVDQPVDVLGKDDIKVYPWGDGDGSAIQSNDWEKIRFREPVEVEGVTTRLIDLEGGQIEVKVRNSKPTENKFGVDAGWFGVTVSRTHFWVQKDEDKKSAVVVVYEGEVEITTGDGKTIKVAPDGDEPGVVVIEQRLSWLKSVVAGVVVAGVIGGIFWLMGMRKGKKR